MVSTDMWWSKHCLSDLRDCLRFSSTFVRKGETPVSWTQREMLLVNNMPHLIINHIKKHCCCKHRSNCMWVHAHAHTSALINRWSELKKAIMFGIYCSSQHFPHWIPSPLEDRWEESYCSLLKCVSAWDQGKLPRHIKTVFHFTPLVYSVISID